MVCDKVVCVSKLCVTKMGARSGRERERDTESKTRTPHKDVGENVPSPRVFSSFGFQICFAQQRRAVFNFSSPQMAPHPPLQRVLSGATKEWKNTVSRLFSLFAHLHLLSSDSFSSVSFFLLLFSSLLLSSPLLFSSPILFSSILFSSPLLSSPFSSSLLFLFPPLLLHLSILSEV